MRLFPALFGENVKRKLKPIDRIMARGLDNYVCSFRVSTLFLRGIGPRTYLHIDIETVANYILSDVYFCSSVVKREKGMWDCACDATHFENT